jgi:hypothetical protein
MKNNVNGMQFYLCINYYYVFNTYIINVAAIMLDIEYHY